MSDHNYTSVTNIEQLNNECTNKTNILDLNLPANYTEVSHIFKNNIYQNKIIINVLTNS